MTCPLVLLSLAVAAGSNAVADEAVADEAVADEAVADEVEPGSPFAGREDLIERAGKSVVVVSFAGRDGVRQGLGSGFVLREDGLIATNLHVIGEARPISVRFAGGETYPVTSVFASERSQDLAILKIDGEGLPALPLGDSDALRKGQPVIALGNPLGLEHSVVQGIVSNVKEDVDGTSMIQLAIPIERGNSGGPVIDLEGNVLGLLTLKSLVADNLGYAVAVNSLKPLLEKPNPVPMSSWLTIGRLNAEFWDADPDVAWRQRAGKILVEGRGSGFGGRSLCWNQSELPERPFEIGVWVRIEEDDGAAGLAFAGDGQNRHYGFYPSSGSLRLSRFDGPTVYSWRVLDQQRTAAYREGEWNHLKVRLEPDRILCYCNDVLVFESGDRQYTGGRAGLAKFRHTTAAFRGFEIDSEIAPVRPDPQVRNRVLAAVKEIDVQRPPRDELVNALQPAGAGTRRVLAEEARVLEQRAQRLRQLSAAVHESAVRQRLAKVLADAASARQLVHAALLLSALDNPDLDVELYLEQLAGLADKLRDSFPDDANEPQRKARLDEFFFTEQGFHGSRTNYYAASNSYLNEAIDDREGLPITLSILYVFLAEQIGLEMRGVGLPGHFVVEYRPEMGDSQLIDVFDRGRVLSRAEAAAKVASITGLAWDEEYLAPQSAEEIVVRILRNLIGIADEGEDPEAALRYVETILAVRPNSPADRLFRAVLCYNTGRAAEGLAEVEWLAEQELDVLDPFQLDKLRDRLTQMQAEQTATGQAGSAR